MGYGVIDDLCPHEECESDEMYLRRHAVAHILTMGMTGAVYPEILAKYLC